jgi:hypothetical protein
MNFATLKKVFGSVIAVLAGAVFIFSGATKLMPVEAFEISLVDIGFASFYTAPVLARLLIGLEFAVGFLLIFHFWLRKITVPLAAGLLVIFTIYILYLLKTYGNRGNCGCFGTVVQFTPLEGVIKNIVLFIMLWIAYQWAFALEFKYKWIAALAGSIILLALPFFLNQIGYPFSKQPMAEFKHFSIDTSILYKDIAKIDTATDITHGKHFVAFMSATCPHCRLAAKKLMVFKKQSPTLPLVFVLYNNKEKLKSFYDDTKAENVPTILMDSVKGFLQITQGTFPRLFWVENDTVKYETNYYVLDSKELNQWLDAKK